ncbi:MAG: hypothetical protein WCP92_08225 [bacterium]
MEIFHTEIPAAALTEYIGSCSTISISTTSQSHEVVGPTTFLLAMISSGDSIWKSKAGLEGLLEIIYISHL